VEADIRVMNNAQFWVRAFLRADRAAGRTGHVRSRSKAPARAQFTPDISVTRELSWAKGKERIR
jgi:hypothetical protein